MQQLKSLIKVQIKSRFNYSAIKHNFLHDKKAFRNQLFIGIAMVLVILYLAAAAAFIVNGMISSAAGMEEVIPSMLFLIASLLSLIFGTIFVFSTLFFAKDAQFLASLPVKQSKIYAAKMFNVYLAQLMVSFLILAPGLILFGIKTGAGILYYILSVFLFLAQPLIPILLASLVCMLTMGLIARSKHRDLIAIVVGIAFLAAVMIGQGLLQQRMMQNPDMGSLIAGGIPLIQSLTAVYIPAGWAGIALTAESGTAILYFFLFILASCALFLLAVPLASRIYYRGALAHASSSGGGRALSGKDLEKKARPPVKAIIIKEFLILLRSPSYAMNVLSTVIIGPLVFVVMRMQIGPLGLEEIFTGLSGEHLPALALVIGGVSLLMAGMNPASASSISREGRTLWLMKTIPVSYTTQIKARFMAGYILSLATALLMGIACLLLFPFPPLVVIAGMAFAAVGSVFPNAMGLMIDLARPKLSWQTEQEAVKQNMNVFLAMLLEFAGIATMAAALFGLLNLGLPILAAALIITALLAALGLVFYRLLMKRVVKCMDALS